MSVFEILVSSFLGAITLLLFVLSVAFVGDCVKKNAKRGELEGKFLFESGRMVWRLVNRGMRNITVVEIGIMCGGKACLYRPLFSQNEEVNSIPYIIGQGEIASFRKEIERFRFKPTESVALKTQNPFIVFYVKDAEGMIYKTTSDVRFADYIAKLEKI